MAIDIGPGCSGTTTSQFGATYTFLNLTNPANADGTIDTCCIYINDSYGNVEDLRFATFTLVSGTTYSAHARANAVVTALTGQANEFSSGNGDFDAFAVSTDDIMGVYYTSGKVYVITYGNSGVDYVEGDQTDQAGVEYTIYSGNDEAMYFSGTGTEGGGPPPSTPSEQIAQIFSSAIFEGVILR